MKHNPSPFKWRHFEPTLILLCVRWYCRYQLSYRDLEEMMCERGLSVDHTTVFRWVQKYAPEINKRIRQHLKMSGTSYRVDETYIKVGMSCKYLYRAVDKEGQTIEFMLSAKRDVSAAKRFFKKMMRAEQRRLPFSISVDKNAAYPEAFSTSQAERIVPKDCKLRRVKYLNNVIEQDHRFIKKKVRVSQCFRSFHTAERTLEGIESLHMMRKGQVKRLDGSDAAGQAKFVASLFCVAALRKAPRSFISPPSNSCNTTEKSLFNPQENSPYVNSNADCSIEVRFQGRLTPRTPSFGYRAEEGPDNRKLGAYTSHFMYSFRFEVRGTVKSGGVGHVGRPGETDSRVEGALPGGGRWTVGQTAIDVDTYARYANGVIIPPAKAGPDNPLPYARNIVGGSNSFSWHDSPGFIKTDLADKNKSPLVEARFRGTFGVYATDGKRWCGLIFQINASFRNGLWDARISRLK